MLPATARSLVRLLAKLPGVGDRTATRYVLHLMSADPALTRGLAEALEALHERVRPCDRCGAPAELNPDDDEHPYRCGVCRDPRREESVLCVVARIQDMVAIERSGAMRGRYFVLGRLISPLDGIGPQDLPLTQLRERLSESNVREVILATPPSVDGEATSLYLAQELADLGMRITRIASGVPHGSDLDLADQVTLGRAIAGRRGFR